MKPFQPIFLKYYSEGDNEQLLKEFNLSMKLSAMATNVGFAGMGALGRTFFKLWLPGQDTDIIYTLTIITILTIIPGGSMHPLYYIYTLTVKQKIPSLVTICGGLFNVVGMVVAIKYTSLGIYAVVWTTVIVMYVINFITNPLYMARVMNYKWNAFYPGIIRNLISELAILGVFFLLSKLLRPTNFWQLGISAVILLIIGIFIHFSVAMSKNEKEQAIKFIVRAINK